MGHFKQRKSDSPHSRLKLVPSGEPNAAGQHAAREAWVDLGPKGAADYDAKWEAYEKSLTAAQITQRNKTNAFHRAMGHFPAEASA